MIKIYTRFRLLRRIIKMRAAKLSFQAKNDLIVPFEEKPAPGRYSAEDDKQISATELFSLFTANVITENRVFVR